MERGKRARYLNINKSVYDKTFKRKKMKDTDRAHRRLCFLQMHQQPFQYATATPSAVIVNLKKPRGMWEDFCVHCMRFCPDFIISQAMFSLTRKICGTGLY